MISIQTALKMISIQTIFPKKLFLFLITVINVSFCCTSEIGRSFVSNQPSVYLSNHFVSFPWILSVNVYVCLLNLTCYFFLTAVLSYLLNSTVFWNLTVTVFSDLWNLTVSSYLLSLTAFYPLNS